VIDGNLYYARTIGLESVRKPPHSLWGVLPICLWGNSPQEPVLRFSHEFGYGCDHTRIEGVAEGGVLTRQTRENQLRSRVENRAC